MSSGRACWMTLCLSAASGAVDSHAGKEPPALPRFVVEATRLERPLPKVATAVSVVQQEAIQQGKWQLTLDESLKGIPGVFVLNPYNYAQDTRIAIRGFGARADFGIRGIRLIIDGIPATTPDGQGEVDGIDLGSAERIEILRGPASAIYGSASGGVVRIRTERGSEVPFLETRWMVGDDDLLQRQIKASGRSANLDYLISGTRFDHEGYRQNSTTEQRRVNAKFGYSFPEGGRLEWTINRSDHPRQDDPGGLTLVEAEADPAQARRQNLRFDAGESVRQDRVGVTYTQTVGTALETRLSGFHTHRRFSNKLPFEAGGQVDLDRRHFGASLVSIWKPGGVELASGVDLGRQVDARENFDNLEGQRGDKTLDQRERVTGLGSFARAVFQVLPDTDLAAALRYDTVRFEVDDAFLADGDQSGDLLFEAVSPMLGLTRGLGERHTLYANVSTAFETPSTTEFDNPSGGGFNTALESQTSRNFEVGARGRFLLDLIDLDYEVAAFHIDIDDALVPFELAAFPEREFFRNAGRGVRNGLETAIGVEFSDTLKLDLSYTWSDFRYRDFEAPGGDFSGNWIPGIPRHFGDILLQYESREGFFAEVATRVVGDLFADDGNQTKVQDYTTTSLTVGWRKAAGRWELEPFFGIRNLFDEVYFANVRINAFGGRHYEPAPERLVFGGIRIRYAFR